MITMIIADDQLLFREMLKDMLAKDEEIEIVASCSNGIEAVASAIKYRPNVILLDISMPNKSGVEALREIKEALPETKVAMLTTFEDAENIKTAIELGADGYLIKDMTPDALILSVKSVYHNLVIFHKGVYKILQSALESPVNPREHKVEVSGLVFDAVEINIMKLIAKGNSNKAIAAILNYSEGTIKNKVSKLLADTGLSDRTEISVFAINHNII